MYTTEDYPPSPTDTYSLSGSVPELYTLSYCSSAFSAASTPEPEPEPEPVKVVKTPAPKKQYQCTHCLKIFSRPSALQTHMYTHTAEKPFQCLKSGCGRKFSVVSNLRRHFKVHQKPSVGNKLSSEDRLRYVRQLIKTSDIILAKQQQTHISLDGRSSIENHMEHRCPSLVNKSSESRYHHYLLLPTINNLSSQVNNYTNEPYSCNSVTQSPSVLEVNYSNYHASPSPFTSSYTSSYSIPHSSSYSSPYSNPYLSPYSSNTSSAFYSTPNYYHS